MRSCKKFRITGRVQGVWFRDSTRREAVRLDLTGYANNLADGSVEVLVCGEPSGIDALAKWLRRGSRLARVSSVTEQAYSGESPPGFSVG